jgi:hypothetical protein
MLLPAIAIAVSRVSKALQPLVHALLMSIRFSMNFSRKSCSCRSRSVEMGKIGLTQLSIMPCLRLLSVVAGPRRVSGLLPLSFAAYVFNLHFDLQRRAGYCGLH